MFVRLLTSMWLTLALAMIAQAGELLPPDAPIEQAIDHYLQARLEQAKVSPAPAAEDRAILRRTMLDLVGRIPTAAEAQEYAASSDPLKREALVDRLMASPGFVRHQANAFDALLMHGTRASLRDYLTKAFRENRGWDQMFREMLLGEEGDDGQTGAIQFVKARANDLDQLTSEASVKFFGVNVSCAQCHDHPFVSDWLQDHYFGMKSFFSRTFINGDFLGEREYGLVEYKTTAGESRQAKLMFLSGEAITEPESTEPDDAAKKEEKSLLEELKKNKQPPPPPGYSRRAQLVEIALRSDGAPFFSQAIVNHLWNRFFGVGLVDPVDQMHSENPPSHPELFDWLAQDMREHGYDLRRLIRGIALSEAYARSTLWEEGPPPPANWFAVAAVRPLSPHQYAMTLRLAAASPEQLAAGSAEEFEKRIESLENAARGWANSFEQPGEHFQVSVDEALLLSNGERMAKELLTDNKNSLVGALAAFEDRSQGVDAMFWNIVSRPPDCEEREAVLAFLERRHDRPAEGWRQAVWALLTSSECRFNH